MLTAEYYFTRFSQSIEQFSLPQRFTFPFYYQPHPLCLLAIEQLQQHLMSHQQWQHHFGLTGNNDNAAGKMFGVLLVKNKVGELGYLSAFSGQLSVSNLAATFVPPVFNLHVKGDFFLAENQRINKLNQHIDDLEKSEELRYLTSLLSDKQQQASLEIKQLQATMAQARQQRKQQRQQTEQKVIALTLSKAEEKIVQISLAKESVDYKNKLKQLKDNWQLRIESTQEKLTTLFNQLANLKQQRKQQSANLQQKIFSQYLFLNQDGEEKSLNDIFADVPEHIPPAGAGECAAPKLLQFAFQHGMQPIAMAEFWWGASPKSEIRQHKNIYPACQSKCQPILAHMLKGMEIDENPLLINPAKDKPLAIIYQDDTLVVVNKPAEFLSVPGKMISDSVYSRIKQQFPQATGTLIVHRLDMSTSGLMVLTLTKRAQKHIQKQFINRTIKKRYVALIDGLLQQELGEINLPLQGDITDRPRQLVCFEHGKASKTTWQVISHIPEKQKELSFAEQPKTKLYLLPETGRTHQLRVHCAHHLGLNMPIIGDDLYGKKANRLHLHAETLSFIHPITKQQMTFQQEPDF